MLEQDVWLRKQGQEGRVLRCTHPIHLRQMDGRGKGTKLKQESERGRVKSSRAASQGQKDRQREVCLVLFLLPLDSVEHNQNFVTF